MGSKGPEFKVWLCHLVMGYFWQLGHFLLLKNRHDTHLIGLLWGLKQIIYVTEHAARCTESAQETAIYFIKGDSVILNDHKSTIYNHKSLQPWKKSSQTEVYKQKETSKRGKENQQSSGKTETRLTVNFIQWRKPLQTEGLASRSTYTTGGCFTTKKQIIIK